MAGLGTESNMEKPRVEWHAHAACWTCLAVQNHVAECVYHQTTQYNLFAHKHVCLVPMFEAFHTHGRPLDRSQHGKSKG